MFLPGLSKKITTAQRKKQRVKCQKQMGSTDEWKNQAIIITMALSNIWTPMKYDALIIQKFSNTQIH